MSSVRRVHAADLVPQPWKNRRGVTWEIAAHPAGAGIDAFDWRVSLARIEEDGFFSLFAGCERWTVCMKGAGFMLLVEDGARLDIEPMRPVQFSGDALARCCLNHGPCTVVNVIFRRERFMAGTEVIPAPQDLPEGPGSALVGDSEVRVRLDARQALWAVFRPLVGRRG